MRFSPYDQSEYALQTDTGCLSPLPTIPGGYAVPEWNLLWAGIPELDDLLNLRRNDFHGFNQLVATFPYKRVLNLRNLYHNHAEIHAAMGNGAPTEAWAALKELVAHRQAKNLPVFMDMIEVEARLAKAQALIDVKEAADICHNILTVDFKARRRA